MTTASIVKTLGASELDTNELVTNLVNATKEPRQKLIDAAKKKAEVAISTTSLLKSALSTLQNAATEIGSVPKLNKLSIASTASSVVTAAPSNFGVAAAGTYEVVVSQLARPQRVMSAALSSSYVTPDVTTLSITGGSSITSGSLTLDAGLTPMQIVAKINESSVATTNKLRATLIDTKKTNPYVIVIEGPSGASSAFSITDGITGTDRFGFETNTVSALNSKVQINGVEIERSSNVISDAINGLTLQLGSSNVGSPATLSVAPDPSSVSDNIKNFVEAYNLVTELLTKATGPAQDDDEIAGSLRADTNARSILMKLRATMTKESSAKSGSITHFNSVGVAFDRNGVLAFDQSKFETAFLSAPGDVIKSLSNNAASPYVFSGLDSGLAGDIAVAAYGMIKSTGVVKAMTDGFEAKKTTVETKQSNLDAYIERLTAQYERQFSALNSVLASFKDTQEQLKRSLNLDSNNN